MVPDDVTKENNIMKASEKVSLSQIPKYHWYRGCEISGDHPLPSFDFQLKEHHSLNREGGFVNNS